MDRLEEVAGRVARGETAAFAQLVSATSSRLVRLAARLLGSQADAEDVVQDAYVKAYRALANGEFDFRSKVETWLFRIVTHASIDALRSRRRRPVASEEVDEAALPLWGGQESAVTRLALKELALLMEGLPPEQRATLVLKAIEGMSSSEIAEVLGCSEGAVEQRLVRARATLRERSGS